MKTEVVASGSTQTRPKDLNDDVVINGEIENFANDIFPLIGETNALNNSAQSLRLAANNTNVLKAEGSNTHQKVDAQIRSSGNPFSKPNALRNTYQFGSREEVLSCLNNHPLTNDPKLKLRGILSEVATDVAGKTSDYIGMERSATHVIKERARLERYITIADALMGSFGSSLPPLYPEDAVISGITEALVDCAEKNP